MQVTFGDIPLDVVDNVIFSFSSYDDLILWRYLNRHLYRRFQDILIVNHKERERSFAPSLCGSRERKRFAFPFTDLNITDYSYIPYLGSMSWVEKLWNNFWTAYRGRNPIKGKFADLIIMLVQTSTCEKNAIYSRILSNILEKYPEIDYYKDVDRLEITQLRELSLVPRWNTYLIRYYSQVFPKDVRDDKCRDKLDVVDRLMVIDPSGKVLQVQIDLYLSRALSINDYIRRTQKLGNIPERYPVISY